MNIIILQPKEVSFLRIMNYELRIMNYELKKVANERLP